MSRLHYVRLFRARDEYIVFHPSCEPDSLRYAAGLPVHAVGRTRAGKTHGYAVENTPVLWSFLRRHGDTVCAACTRVACSEVEWSEDWIQATGMSRYETVPEWEKIWERVADGFLRRAEPPPVPLAVHEQVLGITPPYDHDVMIRAYKIAALKAHPDRLGGSHEAMVRVNAAKDALSLSLGC